MSANSLSAFGAVSYAGSALAFLLLSALMLASWRGQRRGASLILATAVTACWSMLLAYQSARGTLAAPFIHIGEGLQDWVWLGALAFTAQSTASKSLKGLAVLGGAIACLAAPLAWVLERYHVFYFDPTLLLSRSQLATSLLGLVLVEQIYRNSTHSGRQAIKYFAIGIAAIFAYDLFLYSQAELLRGLSLEAWSARGLVMAATVPLIALSAQRTPDWSLDIFVSRQAVFFSTTLLIVGAYLVVMALGGYYVRQFGGEWGRIGQLVFLAGSAVALAGLLTSSTLRRRALVFISKHFYRNKYDYRVEWLRFIETLSSTEEEDVRTTAVRAIAQIFTSPGGILLLRDDAATHFVPAAAWPMHLNSVQGAEKIAAQEDLPRFLEKTKWIVDLKELRLAPDTYGNIVVPQWMLNVPGLRILSPLMQREAVVGIICLLEPPPPFELTYEDRDLLRTVGRHVATHIAQDDASRKLAESRQFEAYNRLTAFMMHDLKNSIAQLKLIVDNAERHKRNPEFIDDAIATVGNAADRMSRLIEQLRGASAVDRVEPVNLRVLAKEAISRCQGRAPVPQLEASEDAWVLAQPERLTSVIEHIMRNAQDATDDSGTIRVHVHASSDSATLSVTDSGCGMTPEFIRDRLFRPFDSTKGAKGMGIGAYQAREYIRSVGGSVDVSSTPKKGTTFSFRLPLAPKSAAQRAIATDAAAECRT
jgi:putative PEP-CTERM system histidine kinase